MVGADHAANSRAVWRGDDPEADWRVGGPWELGYPDGRLTDTGEIVEFEPGKRLGIRWRNEFMPELTAEGWSLCTMEIETVEGAVKLTVTHSIERAGPNSSPPFRTAGRRSCRTSSRCSRPARSVLGPKYLAK